MLYSTVSAFLVLKKAWVCIDCLDKTDQGVQNAKRARLWLIYDTIKKNTFIVLVYYFERISQPHFMGRHDRSLKSYKTSGHFSLFQYCPFCRKHLYFVAQISIMQSYSSF